MNIAGNFDTAHKEVAIVTNILNSHNIQFDYVKKSEDSDNEDVVVKLKSMNRIFSIEIKEESYNRIQKYNDLGIDYISVFFFSNPEDATVWKSGPKNPQKLVQFERSINIKKLGKINYSKADIWMFYAIKDNEIIFNDWFLGKDIQSSNFIKHLRSQCLFTVNNKSSGQYSYSDKHQSATFFINRNDPQLIEIRKDVESIWNEII